MTSRAGQARGDLMAALMAFPRANPGRMVEAESRREAERIVERFEQGVRDGIRTRVRSLEMSGTEYVYGERVSEDYVTGYNDGIGAAAAAISSSSATEPAPTSPLPPANPALMGTVWKGPNIPPPLTSATETQDGERHYQRWHRDSKHDFGLGTCAVCDKPWPCPDATPTPDDRDREVERIAAVLPPGIAAGGTDLDLSGPYRGLLAKRLYDAGLRASGGSHASIDVSVTWVLP